MRSQHWSGIRLWHSIIVLLQDCPRGANGILLSLWEHLSCFVAPQQTMETFHLFFDTICDNLWHRPDISHQSLFHMTPGCKKEVAAGHAFNHLLWQQQINGTEQTSPLKTKHVLYFKFPIMFHIKDPIAESCPVAAALLCHQDSTHLHLLTSLGELRLFWHGEYWNI